MVVTRLFRAATMMTGVIFMIKKILISILAFLLTIFPNSGTLLAPYQSLTYPGKAVVTSTIVDAISAGDIDTIYDMMNQRSKKNPDELKSMIGQLIAAIDGEILTYDMGLGGSSHSESGTGTAINREEWDRILETATGTYLLAIAYTIVHSRKPEEVGVSSLYLFDYSEEYNENDTHWNLLVQVYVPEG